MHWHNRLCDTYSSNISLLLFARQVAAPQYYRKTLTHCRQDATVIAVKRVLQLQGSCGLDAWFLSDALTQALTLYQQQAVAVSRQEQQAAASKLLAVLYAVNEGIAGIAKTTAGTTTTAAAAAASSSTQRTLPSGMAEVMVSAILQSDAWSAQTTVQSSHDVTATSDTSAGTYSSTNSSNSSSSSSTVHVASRVMDAHAAAVSLMMELVATLAEATATDTFDTLLMQLLYPLLDKLADGHTVVRQGALATLYRLYVRLGYASLRDMLRHNMDYIVDDVIAKLTHSDSSSSGSSSSSAANTAADSTSRVHLVVATLLEHVGFNTATPLMQDLVKTVLANVDSGWWQRDSVNTSLAVMKAMANSIDVSAVSKLQHTTTASSSSDSSSVSQQQQSSGATKIAFKDSPWFKQLQLELDVSATAFDDADEYSDAAIGADIDDDHTVEESGVRVTPQEQHAKSVADSHEVRMLQQILHSCQYFVATPHLRSQALATATLCDCLCKLAETKVETVLLPAVHKAWPSLMARAREQAVAAGASVSSGTVRTQQRATTIAAAAAVVVRAETAAQIAQRRAILQHVVSAVTKLVELCGDFLSLKVTEELWPLCRALLSTLLPQLCTPASSSSSSGSSSVTVRSAGTGTGTSSSISSGAAVSTTSQLMSALRGEPAVVTGSSAIKAKPAAVSVAAVPQQQQQQQQQQRSVADHMVDAKVAVALLQCLTALAASQQCRRYMVPLAQEVAAVAMPALACAAPITLQTAAQALFKALMLLDADGMWVLLLAQCRPSNSAVQALAPVKPLQALPDAFPAGISTSGSSSSVSSGKARTLGWSCEHSAVGLLQELQVTPEQFV
jgi:hypothetical protein